MPHTAFTYLVAPDGHLERHWPDTRDAETITGDLRRYLAGGT